MVPGVLQGRRTKSGSTRRDPKLNDLVDRLSDAIDFVGRRVLYSWIGGTRRDWRGQGHFRALTEQQEVWAIGAGFDEVVVKTKNNFFDMRGTLDTLGFEVVKFERHPDDNGESKVYLSKRLGPRGARLAPQRAHRRARMRFPLQEVHRGVLTQTKRTPADRTRRPIRGRTSRRTDAADAPRRPPP